MRKPRQTSNNATYHICARINRQELILEDNQFKLLFLSIVKEAKIKYPFKFKNFCIMGNHVHLEIEPMEDESISRIMQWILSVFAIRYNKIFGYKGHVWYDRFKSKIIQSVQQLINTFFYIVNNPVRAGLTTHPLHFSFNGITYLKNKCDPGLLEEPEPWLISLVDKFLLEFNTEKYKKIDQSISFKSKKLQR